MNKYSPATKYARLESRMGNAAKHRMHTAVRVQHARGQSDEAIQKALNIPLTMVADALDMRIRR